MLAITVGHLKKALVPNSTQLTRKLKPLGRPSFPGYGYKPVRTLDNGLPSWKVIVQRIEKL